MKRDLQMAEVNYKKLFLALAYLLVNPCIAAGFCMLWIWEYHHDGADLIDKIVAPWMWLACFFTPSYLFFRQECSTKKAVLVSLAFAIVFSYFLFFFISFVVAPLYLLDDPYF